MANVLNLDPPDIDHQFLEIPQGLIKQMFRIFLRIKSRHLLSESGYESWQFETWVFVTRGNSAWLAILDRPPTTGEYKGLALSIYGSLRSIQRHRQSGVSSERAIDVEAS